MKEIFLTQGLVALVDDEDFEWLNQYKWQAHKSNKTFYARRTVGRKNKKIIIMHRVILNAPKGIEVDHKDHDGLNNQRHNIRLATHGQNKQNTNKCKGEKSSNYKGVHYFKRDNNWVARISLNSKRKHLGYFNTEIEAALAYDEAAKIYHGEFAKLNFSHASPNSQK